MNSECLLCQLRSIQKHLNTVDLKESDRIEIIQSFTAYISHADPNITNPEMAAELNRLIAAHHPEKEIYKEIKKEFNDLMLGLYDKYHKKALEADDPLRTAMKLAIAGNIIDFGPNHTFDPKETIESVLNASLRHDDSASMFRDIKNADKVLYLADNAGEIVMDKLFISMLNHKGLKVAVRGEPVLNDVVKKDAVYVGLDKIAPVLDNGAAIPSTVLHQCSKDFIEIFNTSDVIISKGQGNLEGLLNQRNKNLYFLFTVKCDAIARLTHTSVDDFVVMHSSRLPDCSQDQCL
ncbi:MAG: damage-control phosphatase ARMT1 family protein [Bacteroidales bacterium]